MKIFFKGLRVIKRKWEGKNWNIVWHCFCCCCSYCDMIVLFRIDEIRAEFFLLPLIAYNKHSFFLSFFFLFLFAFSNEWLKYVFFSPRFLFNFQFVSCFLANISMPIFPWMLRLLIFACYNICPLSLFLYSSLLLSLYLWRRDN